MYDIYRLFECVAAPLPAAQLFLCDVTFLKPLTMRSVFRTIAAHPRQSSSGDLVYGISSVSESLDPGDDSEDRDSENRSVKIGGVTNWNTSVMLTDNTVEAIMSVKLFPTMDR